MTNVRDLADVKTMYGDFVYETATTFTVNLYGKYQPNISFVLPKDFSGNPLEYRHDPATREMIAGFGISFGTGESAVDVLFGDFWLSSKLKPHFRPKSPQTATHVLVRAGWGAGSGGSRTRGCWDPPTAADYFRRASSNGGGTGNDYYVFPVGYHHVVRDEGLDGDVIVKPDYAARAVQVRAAFAQYDRQQAAEAAAKAQTKAQAEAASREARAGFLARFEALQARLVVLQANSPRTAYGELVLGDVCFSFGYVQREALYTEENVVRTERNVTYWEEQYAKRMQREAMIPRFEAFTARLEALGLTLSFGEEKVYWRGSCYGSFAYSQEGLDSFKADLTRKEEEKAKKEREEAAAAAKVSAEAEAAALGLPSDVRIWRRMGGVTNRGNGWVVRPDGSYREADRNPSQGDLVWNQILPGELVLHYHQSDRYDIAHCEVVHRPETVTPEQLAVAKQVEEDMGASENAFGLDDRLGQLIDRRVAVIEAAMLELPEALRPTAWSYQTLVSDNGLVLHADGTTWIDHAEPFNQRCEGRDAQVVYWVEAADGLLEVLVYSKWGGWNLNLRWREDASVRPAQAPTATATQLDTVPDEGPASSDALAELAKKFGR
jgi:hypothetical protein